MPDKIKLDSLKIADPCTEPWENMDGTNKQRFCGSCEKDVFNLSAYSRREAERIVRKSNGRICIRFARLPDGRTITADRPLFQISKRAGSLAAGVMATTLSISGVAYSQGGYFGTSKVGREEPPIVSQNINDSSRMNLKPRDRAEDTSQIRFRVLDQTGAAIPAAKVALEGFKIKSLHTAKTDPKGYVTFRMIPQGNYHLSVSSAGFMSYTQNLTLTEVVEIDFDVFLNAGFISGMLDSDIYEIPLFKAVAENNLEAVGNDRVFGFECRLARASVFRCRLSRGSALLTPPANTFRNSVATN